jgi:LPXTG-motif cell wall-anchored protein
MSLTSTWKYRLAAVAVLWMACAAVVLAQVKTTTTEQKGQAGKQVTVERGEVVYISGNDIVVKMESGEVRDINVPDGATAMVDGKEITIKDLKVGMKLSKTIVTTTTPKMVETVRTGTGTVVNVQAPNYATVRFEDGTVERYRIPKDQKFVIEGVARTAFELKPGMKITATRIVTTPAVEISEQKQVTGTAPPPPPPPPPTTPTMEGALLILERAPRPSPVSAAVPDTLPQPAPAPAAKALPKTGSAMPLLGLLGLLFSGASFGVRLLRRS